MIIGLTGIIGSGKTTVTNYFKSLGAIIIDTDIINRSIITNPNNNATKDLKEYFGMDFIQVNGCLNKDKIRNLIFTDQDAKTKLQNILYPYIYQEVIYQLQQYNCYTTIIILVVPLLFFCPEYIALIHRILVIDCSNLELLITRIQQRDNLSYDIINNIIANQLAFQRHTKLANDIIINNDLALDAMYDQVQQLYNKYKRISMILFKYHLPHYLP